MKFNLAQNIVESIIKTAKGYNLERVILFGSRARGDNGERSDIDLAVRGGKAMEFSVSIDDEARTLLMFDIVELDKPVKKELQDEIEKEGVVLYEKV